MSFQYLGLKAIKKHHNVSDEEVMQQMEHLIASRPRVTPITDRPAKNGDEVILDYAGFCEGNQFEGGTAKAQALVLGSGTFIPGFEEQLVDKSIGEEVSVKVVFPQEYHAEELAGKDAEFRCLIHEIHEMAKYELDEVFAQEVGQCGSIEEMKARMKESMQYYLDQQFEMDLQDSLLQQAASTLEIEISQEQINEAVDDQMRGMEAQLQQQGLNMEMYCQFLNTTLEDMRKEAEPAARQSIQTVAAIEKIAELEKLEASEEDIDKVTESICESNNITREIFDSMKTEQLEKMVLQAAVTSKVMALIREHAEITEE